PAPQVHRRPDAAPAARPGRDDHREGLGGQPGRLAVHPRRPLRGRRRPGLRRDHAGSDRQHLAIRPRVGPATRRGMARRLVVAVVAHPARVAAADQLAAFLGAEVFLDSAGLGAWGNHARALAWAAEQDASHVIVVQDDAEPVPRFLELAAGAIERRPVGPIGFYVGRNRPRAAQVERAVRTAEQLRASWLDADSLLWGVATALPVGDLPALLEWAPSSELPYDARVGRWYRQKGTRVPFCRNQR